MNMVDFNQSRGDKNRSCVLGKSSSTSCLPNQRFGQLGKVAIYVRLSDEDRDKRDKSDDSKSIQNQKSMLIEYAIERGWDIHEKIYCDDDWGGANNKRPDWNELIADAEQGKFNIILCKAQSRFTRDMEMVEKYIHGKFLEWNIRFVSIVDHADTENKGNKKSRQINGLVNEWHLEDLSDNVRRTLNHKKQNGDWMGSFAPYGYMRDPENKYRMIIDEEAAEIVREIFNMYLDGMGYKAIAQELNRRGVLNPTSYKQANGSKFNFGKQSSRTSGRIWTLDCIYYILRKEEYIGTLCQNKSENLSYKNQKRVRRPKDSWTRTYNAHEPIIDMETWNRAQAKLATRTRPDKRTGEKHIFSGKVFCSVCENTLSKAKGAEKYGGHVYLRCRIHLSSRNDCSNGNAVRFDGLEEIVLGEINKLLAEYHDPNKIEVDEVDNQSMLDKWLSEKTDIATQLKKQKQAKEMLYFDKVEGVITQEEFIQYSQTPNDKMADLNKLLAEIETKIELDKQSSANCENKEHLLGKYRQIEKLNRYVVEEFIKRIYIGKVIDKQTPREIKIVWNF